MEIQPCFSSRGWFSFSPAPKNSAKIKEICQEINWISYYYYYYFTLGWFVNAATTTKFSTNLNAIQTNSFCLFFCSYNGFHLRIDYNMKATSKFKIIRSSRVLLCVSITSKTFFICPFSFSSMKCVSHFTVSTDLIHGQCLVWSFRQPPAVQQSYCHNQGAGCQWVSSRTCLCVWDVCLWKCKSRTGKYACVNNHVCFNLSFWACCWVLQWINVRELCLDLLLSCWKRATPSTTLPISVSLFGLLFWRT